MNIASVLQGLATFSWLIVVGIIVLAVVRASRARPLKGAVSLVIGAVIFSLVLTTVSAGLVFIQADQRGVVISAVAPKGYRDQTLQPGLRWVIPFAENVKTYSIARQTYTMSVAPTEGQVQGDDSIRARTRDGQEVNVDASVIYSIDPNQGHPDAYRVAGSLRGCGCPPAGTRRHPRHGFPVWNRGNRQFQAG